MLFHNSPVLVPPDQLHIGVDHLTGVLMSHVDFKKRQCRMSLSLQFPLPLSNLRNDHVPCHHLFGPHIAVANVHVALSNLRNSHVALLALGVKGHWSGRLSNKAKRLSYTKQPGDRGRRPRQVPVLH